MFKKVKKKLFEKNYQKFRLKKILFKIFGDAYLNKRRKWHYLKKKFSFFRYDGLRQVLYWLNYIKKIRY